MAKSQNQKLKLLMLADIFKKYSDNIHLLSVSDIIAKLALHDIEVERKTVYEDIRLLNQYGMDIRMVKGKKSGYFLNETKFSEVEILMLIDNVKANRSISVDITKKLISKLSEEISIYSGASIKKDFSRYLKEKSTNNNEIMILSEIILAIKNKKRIGFYYQSFEGKKVSEKFGNLQLKENFEKELYGDNIESRYLYNTLPLDVFYKNEKYYLIAWHNDKAKFFRLDKIFSIFVAKIEIEEDKITMENINTEKLIKNSFDMFSGKEEFVKLSVDESCFDSALDKFKNILNPKKIDSTCYEIEINVAITPTFFSWCSTFLGKIKIIEPKYTRLQYIEFLQINLDSL